MKVSVVVPAYNEEKNISKTLEALLAQDYSDFEIIVVNNASTDNTFEVASSYKGVKVVTENSKGLLHARERGRVEATGDIIVNVDADCEPEKDWISRGVSYFDADTIAVSGPYYYFDGKPAFIKFSSFIQKFVYSSMHRVLQFFKRGAVLIGGNNFIRAEALRKIGGYDTSILFYGEDTDTAKRLSKVGKMKFITDLQMATSARRYLSEGTFYVSTLYIVNFFWVLFFRRPYSQTFKRKKKVMANRTL